MFLPQTVPVAQHDQYETQGDERMTTITLENSTQNALGSATFTLVLRSRPGMLAVYEVEDVVDEGWRHAYGDHRVGRAQPFIC